MPRPRSAPVIAAALVLASGLGLAGLGLAGLGLAGDHFEPEADYDSLVPSPSKVIGFELGDRPTRYDEIVRYAEAVATASPRARLERHARSHEGRDLVHLILTSEDNLRRLDGIRDAVRTLADPRRELADGELKRLLDDTPGIAYLAYSIHGDELSGADAALRVAYELAAGRSERAERLRDELVVILEPIENPDGRERVLAMNRSFAGKIPNPDPEALSHTAFWPWGRANHYLFDLNRDWFALVHPESRGRADILRSWRPQLVVDGHEMGSQSTYLFSPPRAPFNPNLPASTRPRWERFAADHARAFDAHGWSYFTREWNEEFFPGYGSSLALYSGAVGILYEQAGNDGSPIRKAHGGTLTYREAVHHQYVSSISNLETAASGRRQFLEEYRDARIEAIERGKAGPVRAFYFAPGDGRRGALLATRLAAIGIEVERLSRAGELKSAYTMWDDGKATVALPAGSFRVRLDQPDGLLARAILEPHTAMRDAPLAEEREHLERRKGSRIYDTTAWSPLLAAGLEAWWSGRADRLAWEPVGSVESPLGSLASAAPKYGWLFDGAADGAVVLAAQAAARGLTVRVGRKPFTLGDTAYPRGSFLLRSEENPDTAAEILRELAPPLGIDVNAADTARIVRGPDLGGDQWSLLSSPRIALLAGNPIDFTSLGAAWHLLDKEWGIRVSLLDIAGIDSTDLDRYNVLVTPHAWGGADALRRALGEAGLARIARWVEAGGTYVGIGSGAHLAAHPDVALSSVRRRRDVLEDFPAPRFGLTDTQVQAVERLQATGLDRDGRSIAYAGSYSAESWPEALAIPGAGSPILGPGTWPLLADGGRRERARHPLTPAADDDREPPKLSDDEADKAREKADARLRRFLPSGAILRADLDAEHWLAAGADTRGEERPSGARVAVMVRADANLIARDPARTVGRFAAIDSLHLGGLLWPEAAGRISMTAFLTRESKGRGQIILFSDDPCFRGYFWGTERLFLNAVLLGPGVGTQQTIPW